MKIFGYPSYDALFAGETVNSPPSRITFAISDDVVSVGHSFLSFPQVPALEGTPDNGSGAIYDLETRNGWTGDVFMSFLGYGTLSQLWSRNGIDRTNLTPEDFAFWCTEFGDVGTGMMYAPNTSQGIEGLQATYNYAVTMQNRGARAIFFMAPHPVEALPSNTDAANLGVCQYIVDWLVAHGITTPIYMMPSLAIVRDWQTYLNGSGSLYSDGLHLKQTNNSSPGNQAALAISYLMRYMMTGVPYTPAGANTELTQFISRGITVCNDYTCTGFGGATAITPWSGSDPLPSPTSP